MLLEAVEEVVTAMGGGWVGKVGRVLGTVVTGSMTEVSWGVCREWVGHGGDSDGDGDRVNQWSEVGSSRVLYTSSRRALT